MKDQEYDYFYDDEQDAKYCYPGTNVLKNKLDIRDLDTLHEAERDYSAVRQAELVGQGVTGDFSFKHLCSIHKHLFSDVYSWAGKTRTVDISKGTVFCLVQFIESQFDDLYRKLKKEYRPKLFRRLRTFTWIDPIHETVRLTPVTFDSDVEILHCPQSLHSKRDFSIFIKAFEHDGQFSPKIRTMYAKELLKTGDKKDFTDAKPIFQLIFDNDPADDARKEAACVLARIYRMEDNKNEFFKLTMKDMLTTPCAEICYELGTYFVGQRDYAEAVLWFYNAAYETESILDVHTSGDLPLLGLVECYETLLAGEEAKIPSDTALTIQYEMMLDKYREASRDWRMPEET